MYSNTDHGDLAFTLDSKLVFTSKTVSILVDTATGTLLSHGLPSFVEAKFNILREAFEHNSLTTGINSAKDLVCLTGQFLASDLNRMQSTAGYALQFIKSVKAFAKYNGTSDSVTAPSVNFAKLTEEFSAH